MTSQLLTFAYHYHKCEVCERIYKHSGRNCSAPFYKWCLASNCKSVSSNQLRLTHSHKCIKCMTISTCCDSVCELKGYMVLCMVCERMLLEEGFVDKVK